MFLIELSNTMQIFKKNLYLDERLGLMKYVINQTLKNSNS